MVKIPNYVIKAIENHRTYITNMDSPTYKVGGIKKHWTVGRTTDTGKDLDIEITDYKGRQYILSAIREDGKIKIQFQTPKYNEQELESWFDELEKGIF